MGLLKGIRILLFISFFGVLQLKLKNVIFRIMKAKIIDNKVIIPRDGNSPKLLLEWLAEKPITMGHIGISNYSEYYFELKINYAPKTMYEDLIFYINMNL